MNDGQVRNWVFSLDNAQCSRYINYQSCDHDKKTKTNKKNTNKQKNRQKPAREERLHFGLLV